MLDCAESKVKDVFVASHETMQAGGYRAGKDNLTSGDLSRRGTWVRARKIVRF